MRIVSKIVVGGVILGLLSTVSPAIKESTGDLLASVASDTSRAAAAVAESGGFKGTLDSWHELGTDIINEALSGFNE